MPSCQFDASCGFATQVAASHQPVPPAVGHHSSVGEIIAISVIVGVNSFAWGYGLAAIIRYCRRITFRSTEVADEQDIETQFQEPPPS